MNKCTDKECENNIGGVQCNRRRCVKAVLSVQSSDLLAEKVCGWSGICHDVEGDIWQTECGNSHVFFEGNPKDNSHVYCPYCGKKIVDVT